jgi:hypothetical protein
MTSATVANNMMRFISASLSIVGLRKEGAKAPAPAC